MFIMGRRIEERCCNANSLDAFSELGFKEEPKGVEYWLD